ncbi:hypothetical protein NMY22_g19294 [Coprinellus aureogranulatus]|nr:hypothetical protein NMY22_g19294 [Coprinellus aureogranulatus]
MVFDCCSITTHLEKQLGPGASELSLAASVEVEHLFSKGQILLNRLRNRISPLTTRSLPCPNPWSLEGLVVDSNILDAGKMADVKGEDDKDFRSGWGTIILS